MSKTPIKVYRNKQTHTLIGTTQTMGSSFDLTDIVANVITPDPPPPPPPPAGSIIVEGPTADGTAIQTALDKANPGDTVLVKNGLYISPVRGDDYYAIAHIMKPVTLKAYPGHSPIIDCQANQTWAILVGDARANTPTALPKTIIDGFEVRGANRNGIRALVPDQLIVRNCNVHDNNQGWATYKIVSYEYGIMTIGSGGNGITNDVTIEDCRVWNNGGGLNLYESDTVLQSARNAILRSNFIYANANSGNPGNSSGIACRFTENVLVTDNIMYDGCDANQNGLGSIHGKYLRNILLNAWQPGGNNENFKTCVRGGGHNVIACNILAYSGNTGFDATDGVSDIFINNTVYKNDSWGMLMEGSNTAVLNTISFGHLNPKNGGEFPKDFRPPNDGGTEAISSITSYNQFGDSEHDITYFLGYVMPNTYYGGDPKFTGPLWDSLPRTDPNQVIHPQEYFGANTIKEVQAIVAAKFKPQAPVPCLPIPDASTLIKTTKDAVIAKLQARILAWKDDSAFQRQQACVMWQKILDDFASGKVVFGDLPVLTDMTGKAITSLGAVQ